MNLLEILKNQLTSGNTLGTISSFLGESPAATTSGLGAILPTVLGSVISKGSTTEGASSLLNMIKSGGHDGSILDSFGSILGGGGSNASSLLSSGGGLISSLLGDKVGGIVNLISSMSGLKSGSATSLLSMAAPLVMGLIGKNSVGQGASGLMSMLAGQSDFVKAALPSGISNLMGFGNVGGAAKAAVSQAAAKVEEAKSSTGSFLPYILGAAVLLGGILAYRSCSTPAVDVAETKQAVKATADTMMSKASDAMGAIATTFKAALPGGATFEAPKGSLEEKVVTFIESKDTISKNLWFDFDRLLFETGKATLKPESAEQLKNVAAIMKAYPKVKIKIGGYTDNVGKAAFNLKLSGDRAKNVMAELVKLGTEAPRMEAEGYGDQHPVASNDTEEGKTKNRRISISLRAK